MKTKFAWLSVLSVLASCGVALGQAAPATPVPGSGVTLQSTPQLQITRTVTITRPERPMIWAGLSTETFLPGVSVAVSAPIASSSSLNVALRGGAEAVVFFVPLWEANADLLFSGPSDGVRVYGGPSVGVISVMGDTSSVGWLFGGVLGARNEFRGSNWGWYAEGKARVGVNGSGSAFIPGARLGLTYRF